MLKSSVRRWLSTKRDLVSVQKLAVNAIAGKDYWGRPVLQPLQVSIDLPTSFKKAAETDDLKYSLNYATISRSILDLFHRNEHKNWHSLDHISDQVFQLLLTRENGCLEGQQAQVVIRNSKSVIRCDNVELLLTKMLHQDDAVVAASGVKTFTINGLKLLTVIGIFSFERLQKQVVDLQISFQYAADVKSGLNYPLLVDQIASYVELAQFKTVEALVENVAYIVLTFNGSISETSVAVVKPNAILFSQGVGVSVKRSRSDLQSMELIQFDLLSPVESESGAVATTMPNFNAENTFSDAETHTVYIAFGSNVGDAVANIRSALHRLAENGVQVLLTSALYESKPMYYLDQSNFVNGVLKCSTRLDPHLLLRTLKQIEYQDLKRVKKFDNGPRSIDLDILLYDQLILHDPDLKIPHVSMIDRTFVMAPLCELLPPDALHPVTAERFHSHLLQLLQLDPDPLVQESNLLANVVPLPRGRTMSFGSHTLVMGILNLTPDSFSDGGKNLHLQDAEATIREMLANGVEIIDVGGCSTRPGSAQPSNEVELQRVIPVVELIRSLDSEVIISVDTYRAEVAEKLLLAGADIINDISMGQFDDRMFSVVAKYGVPIMMNHTRGGIDNMNSLTDYSQMFPEDLEIDIVPLDTRNDPMVSDLDKLFISVVGKELFVQISKAMASGVRKWQIILDPGLGFLKNVEQNLATIRTTPFLKNCAFSRGEEYFSMQNLPMLLAPSRKRFIGHVTEIEKPQDRLVANYATLTACIGYGADIIRVHDYKEARQVVLMADLLYRRSI